MLSLRLAVYSPGDFVCRKGDIGKELYIIKSGSLTVVAENGHTVIATLGAGSVLGEISVLNIAGQYTVGYTIVTELGIGPLHFFHYGIVRYYGIIVCIVRRLTYFLSAMLCNV